jgi:signal transduction histidine kinase
MGRDITEIKMALADLAYANQELRDTQSQLVQSEKMASLGSLVAGIAHEINTPVGAIGSMHDTLVRAVDKLKKNLEDKAPGLIESDPQVKNAFELISSANDVINTGCSRVTEIVRRLRSFARLDEAELKKVDIHEGIEDTLILIHHEIKHNITVERKYGEIPPISVYPGRLNQVFLNILNNARQAIEDKGTITIKTYLANRKVHVAISDTGVGISPDDIKNVFDPGFTTKGVGVGTGLGLSICYQIVQEHKGEIKVESEKAKGTVFTVILPMNLDEILDES